jgi:hypothetical protein
MYHAFGGGRLWLHDRTCNFFVDGGVLDDADTYTLGSIVNDTSALAAVTGATMSFNGTNVIGIVHGIMNVATTQTQGGLGLRVTAGNDDAEALTATCKDRASTLVE